jgi:lipoprotein signal peptidase
VRGLSAGSAAGVVLADQLAKMFASSGRVPAVVPVRNPGLALGVLAGPPLLLVAGGVLVLAMFLAVVGRWAVQVGISPIIPGVIAGGSLANALDRAQFGAVRDFLTTPWGVVIDVADIAVVVGIVVLGVSLALRVHHLRATSRTITFDARTLRAMVVPAFDASYEGLRTRQL